MFSNATREKIRGASSMPEPFLVIDALTKRFGKVPALDGIDLALGKDELLVVLGPTGAGKTTLLRTIAGLEEPTSGTIRMNGPDAAPLSPPERDGALVFPNLPLSPTLPVRNNIP